MPEAPSTRSDPPQSSAGLARFTGLGWAGFRAGGPERRLLVALGAFGLALLALWGLERAASGISFHALVASLRGTRESSLLLALGATVVSYAALSGYDLSG